MQFLALFLMMLWPPYLVRMLKNTVFGPRSPGWGGAIEVIMAPFVVLGALLVVAVWISVIFGLITLIQHTSVTFH